MCPTIRITFGPKPRSYGFRVPNKVVKLAMKSVLSAKTAEGALIIVDDFGLGEPSTKTAASILKGLGIEGRATVVVNNEDAAAVKSFRNIEKVQVITASQANTYDLVNNTSLVFAQPAVEWLEGVLS